MVLSVKTFTLAIILSLTFHFLISRMVSIVFPQQQISAQPYFVFWGSILKTEEVEEPSLEESALTVLPSLSAQSSIEERSKITTSIMKLQKPLSPKVLTEKQNLKSNFEMGDVEESVVEAPASQTSSFTAPLRPYKRLRFPSKL